MSLRGAYPRCCYVAQHSQKSSAQRLPVGCGLREPAPASVTSCLRSGERASKPNHAPKHVTGRGGRDERSQCFATHANLPSLPPTLDTFGLRFREHSGAASLQIFSNLFRRSEDHERGYSYASRPLVALRPLKFTSVLWNSGILFNI